MQRLDNGNGDIINSFQKNLVSQLFAKYFGDPYTINSINKIEYVELIIAATRLLKSYNMIILPYIISSKMSRIQNKKNINKKEQTRLENAAFYQRIKEKYQSEAVINQIFSIIATIIASKFEIIDFENTEIDGRYLDKDGHQEIVCDEVLMFCSLI